MTCSPIIAEIRKVEEALEGKRIKICLNLRRFVCFEEILGAEDNITYPNQLIINIIL